MQHVCWSACHRRAVPAYYQKTDTVLSRCYFHLMVSDLSVWYVYLFINLVLVEELEPTTGCATNKLCFRRSAMRTENKTPSVTMQSVASRANSRHTERHTRRRRSTTDVPRCGSGLTYTQLSCSVFSCCVTGVSYSSLLATSALTSDNYKSTSQNNLIIYQSNRIERTYPPPRGDLRPFMTHCCAVVLEYWRVANHLREIYSRRNATCTRLKKRCYDLLQFKTNCRVSFINTLLSGHFKLQLFSRAGP